MHLHPRMNLKTHSRKYRLEDITLWWNLLPDMHVYLRQSDFWKYRIPRVTDGLSIHEKKHLMAWKRIKCTWARQMRACHAIMPMPPVVKLNFYYSVYFTMDDISLQKYIFCWFSTIWERGRNTTHVHHPRVQHCFSLWLCIPLWTPYSLSCLYPNCSLIYFVPVANSIPRLFAS